MFFQDNLTTLKLAERITMDVRPENIDLVYLFGQTEPNENSVLVKGLGVRRAYGARIGICDEENYPKSPYRGAEAWTQKLLLLGLYKDYIVKIPMAVDLFPPSTDSEAHGLIRFCIVNRLLKIAIVAPPFHIVRAATSTVSAIIKQGHDDYLNVWFIPGELQSWMERVKNVQSTAPMRREDQVESEVRKIEAYFAKGDLVSLQEIMSYLNVRDARCA